MRHLPEHQYAKPVFVGLSLFLICMTIALTVVQTRQSQDNRSSAASDLKNCDIGQNAVENSSEEKKVIKLINDYRQEKDLEPLKTDDDLNRAAAWMSDDQAKEDRMSHEDSKGRDYADRVPDCGYKFSVAVENVGELTSDADAIFSAWQASDDHRKNMLCKDCVDIGIAEDKEYWTMVAGAPLKSSEPTNTSKPTKPETEPTEDPKTTRTPRPTREPKTTITPATTLPPALGSIPAGKTGLIAHVIIPGIGENGNTTPLNPNRHITVSVYNNDNKEVAKVDGTMSYTPGGKNNFYGAIELPDSVESGSYLIKLQTDYSLIQTVTSGYSTIKKGEVLSLPTVSLPVIDFTQNNIISLSDVFFFQDCLETGDCELSQADVNDDGVIDINDYTIIIEEFASISGQ